MELFITLSILYAKLIAGVVVGIFFQLIAKDKSMKKKDEEVEGDHYPGFWVFIRQDQGSIYKSLAVATLLFLIIGKAINPDAIGLVGSIDFWGFTIPKQFVYEGVLVMLFSTAGYVGQDYALRIYSYTNSKLNKDIAADVPKKTE